MDHGKIAEQGTFEDLTSKPESMLYSLMKEVTKEEEQTEEGKASKKKDENPEEKAKKNAKKAIVAQEDRAKGSVSPLIWYRYLMYTGGPLYLILIFGLFCFAQFVTAYQSIFLSDWTTRTHDKTILDDAKWLDCNFTNYFFQWGCTQQFLYTWLSNDRRRNIVFVYLFIYCGLGFASIFIGIFRDSFWRFGGIRASYLLFKKAFSKVLYSPSAFFDTTPIGRILSRLTKDVEILDTTFLDSLGQFSAMAFTCIGIFGVVLYSL